MFNLDFTFEKYKSLCEAISQSCYSTLTFEQYCNQKNLSNKCIILRHDVEREIDHALKMANIENQYNIVSTYYCRKTDRVFKPDYFKKIASFGHEIGYHYETLDKAEGDLSEAVKIFEKELYAFRKHINVTTACMHGRPFSQWNNLEIWKEYDFKDFSIIGEPYLSIDYNKVLYLTDTGRTWADKNIRVKDVIREKEYTTNTILNKNISNTDDIINLIQKEEVPQVCILVHPDRWSWNYLGWIKELISQNIKNIGKAGIIRYRNLTNN